MAWDHLKELSREEALLLVEEAREKTWKDQAARLDDSFNRGIAQGKKEMAVSMLKNGLEMSLISKITRLSEEKINRLKEPLS